MKEKTIYIANDGRKFDTKEDCIEHETGTKARLAALSYEKRSEENKMKFAFSWMQLYKSNANTSEYYVDPNTTNIVDCMNLSRAEAIYRIAKDNFKKSLNIAKQDLYSRALLISHTSHILIAAIEKRKELINRYKECKKQYDSSKRRINEIDIEMNKIRKEIKDV